MLGWPQDFVNARAQPPFLPPGRAYLAGGPGALWQLGSADLVPRAPAVVDPVPRRHLCRRLALLAAARSDPLVTFGAEMAALGGGDAAPRPLVAVPALLRGAPQAPPEHPPHGAGCRHRIV